MRPVRSPSRSLPFGCVRRRDTRLRGGKVRMNDHPQDLPGCGFTLERTTDPRGQQRNGCLSSGPKARMSPPNTGSRPCRVTSHSAIWSTLPNYAGASSSISSRGSGSDILKGGLARRRLRIPVLGKGDDSPLRISFPCAVPATYRTRRLQTQRILRCGLNDTFQTRSRRCVNGQLMPSSAFCPDAHAVTLRPHGIRDRTVNEAVVLVPCSPGAWSPFCPEPGPVEMSAIRSLSRKRDLQQGTPDFA